MPRTVLAVCLVLFTVAAAAASWVTNSFRTPSGDLVQRGDTMTKVLQSAGVPLDQRVISHGVTIAGVVGLTRVQWTYRGSDGIYVVTFAGSEVERIEVVADR